MTIPLLCALPALDEAFRLPQRVGPYRIERLLGRGGFAPTYLAHKGGEKRPVTMKLVMEFVEGQRLDE